MPPARVNFENSYQGVQYVYPGGQNCAWGSTVAGVGSKVESTAKLEGSPVHKEGGNDVSLPVAVLIHYQERHP